MKVIIIHENVIVLIEKLITGLFLFNLFVCVVIGIHTIIIDLLIRMGRREEFGVKENEENKEMK